MIPVLDLTERARVQRFRIMRQHTNYAGTQLRDVPTLDGADGLYIHAADAETALKRARLLVRDARNLIAVSQES